MTMAISGPDGSETKPSKKIASQFSDNPLAAGTKYPAKHLKKGRGRPPKQSLLIMKPVILDDFRNLFPTKPHILEQIKENMNEKGFSKDHPIIVGKGPWTEGPFILDGHSRHDVAISLGIEPVYASNTKYYETMEDALKDAIYLQKARRNITDADILSCIEVVDKLKSPGRPTKEIASTDAVLESDSTEDARTKPSLPNENKGKSAKETADIVGTSPTKVDKARVILAAPAKFKEQVLSGKKSIHSASNEAKELKKAETTPPVTTPLPVSAAPTVEIQTINNDVAAENGTSNQSIRDMMEKLKSMDPEYNAEKILEAGVYFRKFDTIWAPGINLAEALPASDLDKVVTRFNNLVARIKAKADEAAKFAAKNQTLPGIDLKAPIKEVL
jgi:ParB family chromosome partitioning protein